MPRLNRNDVAAIIVGIVLAICGELYADNGLSFSGGALLGAVVYRLGRDWNAGEAGDA